MLWEHRGNVDYRFQKCVSQGRESSKGATEILFTKDGPELGQQFLGQGKGIELDNKQEIQEAGFND